MAEATVGGENEELLTAAEVKEVQFGTGRRGYKEEDVDNFLERVEETLQRLSWDLAGAQQEAEALRARVRDLEARVAEGAQSVAVDDGERDRQLEAAARELEELRARNARLQDELHSALNTPAPDPVVDPGQAAAKVLQLAQRTAAELLEQSRSESAAQLNAAERTARQTIAQATSEAAARSVAIAALEDGLAHLTRGGRHTDPAVPGAAPADGDGGWPHVA
jgi:DivIVA domain-containing protein